MPPQHLTFLHSFQQHVTGHSLHALIVVRYQTEVLNIFSSNQKGDFSATQVEVLKYIQHLTHTHQDGGKRLMFKK